MANASDNQLDADARHRLCLAIDEELAAFLCCVDTYETASREVWDRPHRAKLSPRPASDTVRRVRQIVAACKSGIFDISRARKSMGYRCIFCGHRARLRVSSFSHASAPRSCDVVHPNMWGGVVAALSRSCNTQHGCKLQVRPM
jgi:hypothetical protein